MTVELIISCSVAVLAVVYIIFKRDVRNVREIALSRKVAPCEQATVLRDLLEPGKNRTIAARYFYEAPAVRAFFWMALLSASLVLLGSGVSAFIVPMEDGAYVVPEWATRGLHFAVVISLISSLAAGVLAGKGE